MTIIRYENEQQIRELFSHQSGSGLNVMEAVTGIINHVRLDGDKALIHYTEKFDGVRLPALAVTGQEIREAYEATDPYFIETLEQAKANIEAFHKKQVRNNFMFTGEGGVVLGQRVTPIDKVGVYVPGGTASYPSTVLMDVIPAKIAGVEEIIMVTPPGKDGKVAPAILAAAKVAGVDRIFKLGGAQAVAALSYGTETVPRVDKIVGPGNIYVATAKQLVYGQGLVAIEMVAGPSEILILADETGDPRSLAADLLSQAEHDKLASAILVTTDAALAQEVLEEVERQLALLPREEIARASIENFGKIIVCGTMEQAVQVSNMVAPEHLEVCTRDPFALLDKLKHAGSIFLGAYTPEALGDYFAGPNHTLPTSGTARFSSPLSVDDFCKKSSFIYYTRDALEAVGDRVADFARREGLDAHARSVEARMRLGSGTEGQQ